MEEERFVEALKEALQSSWTPLLEGLAQISQNAQEIASSFEADSVSRAIYDKIAPFVKAAAPQESEFTPPPAIPSPMLLNNQMLFHLSSIEYSGSQIDTLKQLILACSDHARRGILFILKGTTASGWNSFGFPPDSEKKIKIDCDKNSIISSMIRDRKKQVIEGSPDFLNDSFQIRRSIVIPLLLKGKVAAFFYADCGQDGKLDHYSLDILIRYASLCIDIAPLKEKRAPLEPTLETLPIIIEGNIPVDQEAGEVLAEETTEGVLSTDDSGSLSIGYESKSEEESAEEPVEEERAEVIEEVAPAPPPPPEEDEPIPPEDKKIHDGAKRFAKLLIQEIALYHPQELEQGKTAKKIRSLLKDDIERSEQTFNQRYSNPNIRKRNYFEKALIEYLADGNPSLLG